MTDVLRRARAASWVPLLLVLGAFALHPTPLGAQAVYGSIGGTVTDPSGAVLPGVTVTITSLDSTDHRHRRHQRIRIVRQRAAAARRRTRCRPSSPASRPRSCQRVEVGVDSQTPVEFMLEVGQLTDAGRRHRRSHAAQDRPRRRRDELRLHADHRSAGARSQLHQVHAADAGHAAAAVAARRQREPAGLDPDDGQRPALQRHELSARRHRQPRSDPRHHRHQPDAGVDRRNEDHLAELRRGVRPGRRRRRVGADAGRAATRCAAAPSSSSRTTTFQARNPFTQFQRRSADRPLHSRDQARTSSAASIGGPIVQNRWFFFGDYQGTQSHAGRLAAAVGADRGGARRRSQRLRRQHLRSADRASSSTATVIPHGPAVAAGAAHPRSDPARRTPPGRDNGTRDNYVAVGLGDVRRELVQRPHRRPAVATSSTPSAATASATSSATARPSFGQGGGQELVSLGGVSDVRNHSLAYGMDYTLSPTLLADFRFGFFQLQGQRAAVRLRHDAGGRRRDSRPEPDNDVRLGTAGRFHRRRRLDGAGRIRVRIGSRRQPLQLPARSGREAVAAGRQRHQAAGQPHASSSASTSAAPTTCACRATRTDPAS